MKDLAGSFDWQQLLTPRAQWAAIVACEEPDIDEFLASDVARQLPAELRVVRGQRCRTSGCLLREWAAALQFPYYFGMNWNALVECLSDLDDWLPAAGYVVFQTNADLVLADEPEWHATWLDALRYAAAEWREQPTPGGKDVPFRVVFQCASREDCIDRFAPARPEFIDV